MTAITTTALLETSAALEIASNVAPGHVVSFPPLARDFPAWHFAMLNDEDRNRAIESAIAGLDLHGKIIFEIGTGCGVVALLFAKFGAAHVYSCEINPRMAEIARAVIGRTNLADRITLFRASSSEVIEH